MSIAFHSPILFFIFLDNFFFYFVLLSCASQGGAARKCSGASDSQCFTARNAPKQQMTCFFSDFMLKYKHQSGFVFEASSQYHQKGTVI